MRELWRRRREAERGAMAIVIAIVTCFALIPLSALAIDLGMQRVARSDAQSVANITSMNMARLLASSGRAAVTDQAAQADAIRSSGAIGKKLIVRVYVGTLSQNFVSDQSLGCDGTTFSNAYFTRTETQPTAVLVTASNVVNYAIHGGTGSVCRSAIAQATPATPGTPGSAAIPQQACVTINSYAAQLRTGDSTVLGPLTKLLGTSIDTSVLSSSGILTTDLSLLDFLNVLKTNLGVGTIDQVLAANISATQFVNAEIDALTQSGVNNVAIDALRQQILAKINTAGSLKVSDLLGVTAGGAAALASTINPLDLASAAVFLANGSAAVGLNVTGQNLLGLSASVKLVSGPRLVCLGDGTQTLAQASITATADINAPGTLTAAVGSLVNGLTGLLSTVLGTLGSLLGASTYTIDSVTLGPITASVSLASVTGKVNSLTCNGTTPTGMSVQEGSALAPASITVPVIIKEKRSYGLLGLSSEYATSTLTLTITTHASSKSVVGSFALPGDMNVAKQGPANNLSVDHLNVATVLTQDGKFSTGLYVVKDLLNGLSSVINQVQATIVAPLESLILTPLFNTLTTALTNLLGVSVAGSTYTPTKAVCGQAAVPATPGNPGSPPKLVG